MRISTIDATSRTALLPLAASCGIAFCAAIAMGDGDPAGSVERIERTRDTLERWVETRRVISRENADWALGRELLAERIRVVEADIAAMRTAIAEAEAGMADAERQARELDAERDTLTAASRELASRAAALETRTKELVAKLPEPIRERIRPFSQLLPADPTTSDLSVPKRYGPVIGILNEINKFHRNIAVESEIRALPDGTSIAVTTVYLGLGCAFYVNEGHTHAGTGTLGASGWTWTPRNEAAKDIAAAIAILKDEAPARFVRIPLDVQ